MCTAAQTVAIRSVAIRSVAIRFPRWHDCAAPPKPSASAVSCVDRAKTADFGYCGAVESMSFCWPCRR